MESFKKLGISEDIIRVISAKKFEKPSEIQERAIPIILEGKDIIAGSATGSGKTLAFAVGIIKNVQKGKGVQALILTPTRELAEQVAQAIEEFAYHKGLEVLPVYGGVSINHQIKRLTTAEVVVATPGRLLDHMSQKSIDLSHVDFLVLDEADRMWDMGFKDDVGKIVKACPVKRQTMLFSATISSELADFSSKYMKSPTEVAVKHYVDATKLKQIYYDARDNEKFSLLVHLLNHEKAHLVMIFCNTRRNADFVAKNLNDNGISAQVIHGGMEQSKRNRVMKGFDSSKVNILVCTDVAARGLDIEGVSHIYNYDIPSDSKDYIHRIGRTARAGKEGIAINIITSRDYDNFANFQRHNPEVIIKREMTPQFPRIFVKWEAPRERGRPMRGGRGGSRGPPRSGGSRGPPRRPTQDGRGPRGPPRRSSDSDNRRPSHNRNRDSKPRTGFRGGGRNTSNRRGRR
ncbi:MAG: DEAD/DEAH box helicase [archaeon]|nr:DEAD/DEAH box helicase [archaeon]MCR4323603.1 DEAD/DEAH box helicase [Nanoarchaeota archaeon]